MRLVALMFALLACGCVGSGEARNPLESPKRASTAPVASAAAAPVESDAAPAAIPEAPTLPTLTRVQAMKELFLQRKAAEDARAALEQRFLRLAEGLSVAELKELNEFLGQHGVQLHRRCQNPDHNHDEDTPDHQEEDEQGDGPPAEKGRVY